MANVGDKLLAMYEAMRARFGPQHWWPSCPDLTPHDRKLEICVGAILTQNTNWRNVQKALCNLITAGAMNVQALREMPLGRLAELIRPAGYYNVKARRVKAFLDALPAGDGRLRDRHRPPPLEAEAGAASPLRQFLSLPRAQMRRRLLAVVGIGPETADCVILYAAGKPSFVVDAYTRRILLRHGLIERRATYDEIQSLFEDNLPGRAALFNEYHALLVAVGKLHCRPTARCPDCPLERFAHDGLARP